MALAKYFKYWVNIMIGPDGVIMMVMADDDKRFKLFIHMTYELKLRYELQIRLDSLTH